MSKPRYKTWKGVIVKTDIQDKDGAVKGGQYQCQSQDTVQEKVPMSNVKFETVLFRPTEGGVACRSIGGCGVSLVVLEETLPVDGGEQ